MSRRLDINLVGDGDGVWSLVDGDLVLSSVGIIDLDEVADVLSDPLGWIEFETEYQEYVEEWETPPDNRPARVRIFSRAVATIGMIFDCRPERPHADAQP